jgi:hypothetical protein
MPDQAIPTPVVSYCTTCKGRLAYLKQTLPGNMMAERDNPNVEFVVLDYDCPDGTADWLKAEFGAEIASGRLRCGRHAPAPTFEHAHAKNMAHRLATGSILCNVDADNFIAPGFSAWLVQAFKSYPDRIVINIPVRLGAELNQKILWRLRRIRLPTHGLAGRIAISRANFERLGGYDETAFSGIGGEDTDLGLRARVAGLHALMIPHRLWGDVIRHGDDERVEFSSKGNRAHLSTALRVSRMEQFVSGVQRVLKSPAPAVNLGGQVGCGDVMLNFDGMATTLRPLPQHPAR